MSLKINGIDSIYGCYSHNSFITTFHRRCYWLLTKPNIVLVHYLLKSSQQQQQQQQEDNQDSLLKCEINIIQSLNLNLKETDYLNELLSILWPFTLKNDNYLLIEGLIKNVLFQTNQLKRCLKLTNINELIQKYNLNCLNINFDIPLIEIISSEGGGPTAPNPPTLQLNNNQEEDDIYLSKTKIQIGSDDYEEEIIYLIIKNELKYKLNTNLKYYIQLLNNNLTELKFINSTLLELKLNKSKINPQQPHEQLNEEQDTFLYFYDSNFNLIYKPFNFKIQFNNDESRRRLKYRLIILEKLLFLYNLLKLNVNLNFGLEYEERLIVLVDDLKDYLTSSNTNACFVVVTPTTIINNDDDDDYENKSLFHLTIICNYKNLFSSLLSLFKTIQQQQQSQDSSIFYSQLNPNRIDAFNLKAIDYAKKFNYFDFIQKLNELEESQSNNNEFILNDDLSWLNDINENDNEFPIVVDEPQLFNQPPVPQPPPPQTTYIVDDDQDKKIKTLADNIIAAMPMKIKSSSYSFINSTTTDSSPSPQQQQQQQQQKSNSFDFNDYRQNSIGSTTTAGLGGSDDIYSSPLSSIDNQSPSASNFHIDSPPSTAEFSKYFHAKKTYKSFENDFSQLTLTDDEQRELYEAALIIQNAYRRYLKRKHTKVVNNDDINNFKQLKSTATVAAAATLIQNVFCQTNNNITNDEVEEDAEEDEEENGDGDDVRGNKNIINNIEDEQNDIVDTKQYEAACIIQKYFRRYKQVSL